jgi:uncharacterized protein
MKSLDTNILLYAANSSAPEHAKAILIVNTMLASPTEWVIADQVLWEYYKALRHPKILKKPCTAVQAAAQVRFIRQQSGVSCCAYEVESFDDVAGILEAPRFPYQRTHDTVLGITLLRQGVTTFYTRNEKDFANLGFQQVVNPIDG